MDKFKEFQGRDLDECIKEACSYFDAPREKLEIEIIQDAKSGIFGIVLARKAKIRARRAHLENAVLDMLGADAEQKTRPARNGKDRTPESQQSRPIPGEPAAPAQPGQPENAKKGAAERKPGKPHKSRPAPSRSQETRPGGQQPKEHQAKEHQTREHQTRDYQAREHQAPYRESADMDLPQEEFDAAAEDLPLLPLESLDADRLRQVTVEIVERLVEPLAGHKVNVTTVLGHGSIHARVDWQGDAGLLIGREGQTLAALQYLASRMLSHAFNAGLRVQLDIGEYRTRQDDKLRNQALSLAEKARQTGRSFSTRPLSSYHRRVIHLALQSMTDIQTRSSGEGALKRVVISARKQAEKE